MNRPFVLGATQNLTTSASAATTSAISGPCTVRVAATKAAYIAVGTNPTADNTGMVIPDNGEIFLSLADGLKISALQVAAAGAVSITIVQAAAWC